MVCVCGHCISHQLMGTICTPRNTTCQGFPFPKLRSSMWKGRRPHQLPLGQQRGRTIPACGPWPVPTCLAACHHHAQLVLRCAQQVVGLCVPQGDLIRQGLRERHPCGDLANPTVPPASTTRGKDTTLARTMSPGRKLLYTSTCTGESRQNHTACQGAHQRQDKCPPPAEGGGSCGSTVTGSASLTLSFSVARISSLLKKETEGSECQ